MNMQFIKRCCFILLQHIVFAVLSLFITSSIVPASLSNHMLGMIVTIVTSFIYLSAIYSYCWNNAAKDRRLLKSQNKFCGVKIDINYFASLGVFVMNTLVLALALAGNKLFDSGFRVLNLSFMSLVIKNKALWVEGSIVAVILPLVVSFLGYLFGTLDKSFLVNLLPKIIYKQKK